MRELRVDYGQASIVKSNMSMSLSYLEDEISKINSAINEIESLNRSYGKTSTILNELYDQKKKAQQSYDEMQEFNEKFSKFISNVKTTDTELAKKFTSDVKTYCKKNNIEITSELDAFLDKVQVALDLAGWLPIVGDVADGINAAISLCRGNYLEALICVVAMLPFGDMVKSLKYADEAKGILKYGDEFLKGVKTVAKEGSEKLSKQMSKVIKSGKLDNVIASMDAGKHYIVKMRDGTVTAIEKTGLPEKIGMCLGNGCFIAGTLVTTRSGLRPIEEIKIGDYVLSRNEETGEDSYKKVTDTLVRSTQEICTIELENGKIKSTTGHLFMVKDKWWKAALELEIGDVLITSEEKEQVVKSIKVEEKGYPVTTYNLTVEDNHTFFVGEESALTHNTLKLKPCNIENEIAERFTKEISDVNFKKSNIRKMNSFQEDIVSILKSEKISLDEFNSMRMKCASELTDEERKIMMKIREQVPKPDSDTVLQKVIDGGKIDNYIKDDNPWNTVGGFITRAQDTKELSTLQEVYDGLALGYKDTPFKVGVDKDYGVIRFKTNEVDKIDIPYGPSMERVGAKAPSGGFDTSPDPFTGHGFTKDMNGNIIPEYTMDYIKPKKGAELYRVNSETGVEELIARYINGKFVKIK